MSTEQTVPDEIMTAMAKAVEQGRAGDTRAAREALEQLWESVGDHGDALHRCSIAHYAADLQETVTDELMWDERALAAVTDLTDERARKYHDSLQVRAFLPSLHLNLADAHRRAGNATEAQHHLAAATETVHLLPDDEYGQMIRAGIAKNHAALGENAPTQPPPHRQ
ncbi:hypothetical protein AB0M02_26810 [Actinoplanes sp. NPDC051861]|uniref:hypothetical protein n=1 Tax=Actinoplanes sp. NPDC051861 TaxID=3155170 RepID=UPI0034159FE5